MSIVSLTGKIRNRLSPYRRLPRYFLTSMQSKNEIDQVRYIVEAAGWSIEWDGRYISGAVRKLGLNCRIDTTIKFLQNTLIHFGSVNLLANHPVDSVSQTNVLMATFFHGQRGLSDQMDQLIDRYLQVEAKLSNTVVSTSIMRDRLIGWGVPENKISLIPLGVDNKIFRPYAAGQRLEVRKKLGIPDDAICVGSFQKDGEGWGEGLTPKLIKGPDIFLEVIAKIKKNQNVFCLLTGPARGYVKKGLESLGVKYAHHFLERYEDIVDYYNALDYYLVTSREEGGPKAILESMATGVPLLTTCVGMAPDIVRHGENGFVFDGNKMTDEMAAMACEISNNNSMLNDIKQSGLQTAADLGWDEVGAQYLSLYRRLMMKD